MIMLYEHFVSDAIFLLFTHMKPEVNNKYQKSSGQNQNQPTRCQAGIPLQGIDIGESRKIPDPCWRGAISLQINPVADPFCETVYFPAVRQGKAIADVVGITVGYNLIALAAFSADAGNDAGYAFSGQTQHDLRGPHENQPNT